MSVKSIMEASAGTETTYFVGGHYQVVDDGTTQTILKYYAAGAQRIAMRTNGTLNFLLGDHLGSTSLVTDANGQNPIETRYTAWGEIRYSSGLSPTDYTYTGQYSYHTLWIWLQSVTRGRVNINRKSHGIITNYR